MKKLFAIFMVAVLAITMFAGCAKNEKGEESSSTSQAQNELKEGTKLSDIVDKINEDIGIAMPGDMTAEMLEDMYGLDDTTVEDFSGKYAQIVPGVDEVTIVKAKEGKIDDVKAAMEKRKTERTQEQYLPDMIEKAESGRVVTKGNYAALLIVGDPEKGIDQELDKAEDIFLSYFKA